MFRIYKKIPHLDEGDFKKFVKSGTVNFKRNFTAHFRELPEDKGGITWTASSKFGTYHLCEQQRFRRACASAQSRQNLRCSLIQALSQEEPSDRKPDP